MAAGDEKDCADRRRRYDYSMESRRRYGYPAESRRRHGSSTESRRQNSYSTESRRRYGYSKESRQNSGMGYSDRRNPRRNSDRQRDCYPRLGPGPLREERDEEYWRYMERRWRFKEDQRRREDAARRCGVEPLERRGLSPNRYTNPPDPNRLCHYCIYVEFPDETFLPKDLEAYYLSFFPQVPEDTPKHKRPRLDVACDPKIFRGFFAWLLPKHLQHMKSNPAFRGIAP